MPICDLKMTISHNTWLLTVKKILKYMGLADINEQNSSQSKKFSL